MKENISENVKKTLEKFNELEDFEKLYLTSIILNHLDNGLINDGNYMNEEEAYENKKEVLTSSILLLDDPMKLATNLLVVGATLEKISINPNGVDIEPYINNIEKLPIKEFYQLSYQDKIDYLAEIFYEISTIAEVEQLKFDFNALIGNLLDYSRELFGKNETNLETL